MLEALVAAFFAFLIAVYLAEPAGATRTFVWMPISGPGDFQTRVLSAIRSTDLKGLREDLVYTVFHLETGGGHDAKGLADLNATRNLSNRHKGVSWHGPIFYVSPDDPDLRVYTSLEASVADFVELMQDPLYATAFQAGQAGPAWNFFHALKYPDPKQPNKGYSTQPDYDTALLNRYAEIQRELA